jgi:uncharacterized protein (TIGR02246 family)
VQIRTIAAFIATAMVPSIAYAAPSPPAPIAKLTDGVIRGTSTDDPSRFAKLFTGDAVVVDENPPFVWRGADAGAAWWDVVRAVMQKANLTHIKPTNVRIGEFRQSATDAYLVQSMTITGIAAGKPFAERGTLTYTFHKADGRWLISSMVWTTKP